MTNNFFAIVEKERDLIFPKFLSKCTYNNTEKQNYLQLLNFYNKKECNDIGCIVWNGPVSIKDIVDGKTKSKLKPCKKNTYNTVLFKYKGYKISAKRLSYYLYHKKLPVPNIIKLKCDIPFCINPLHFKDGNCSNKRKFPFENIKNQNNNNNKMKRKKIIK